MIALAFPRGKRLAECFIRKKGVSTASKSNPSFKKENHMFNSLLTWLVEIMGPLASFIDQIPA